MGLREKGVFLTREKKAFSFTVSLREAGIALLGTSFILLQLGSAINSESAALPRERALLLG